MNRSKAASIPGFRSQMCLRFKNGRCYYGGNCHFAHTSSDLEEREIRRNVFVVACRKNEIEIEYPTTTRDCNYFTRGEHCPFGDRCQFRHKCDNKSLMSAVVGQDCNNSKGYNMFYKTRLCNRWVNFGSCSNGLTCRYAHGTKELKNIDRLPEPEKSIPSKGKVVGRGSSRAALSEIGTKSIQKLKVKSKRCFENWSIEKISRIYADWLDA